MKDKLGRFVKGNLSWNKGTKGIMKPNKTSFKKGMKKSPTAYKFPKGKSNISYKGGIIMSRGYIFIRRVKHPFSHNGYIKRARLVMERWLRKNEPNHSALIEINGIKYLKGKWIVHHKGIKYSLGSIENKQDDRIENLHLCANKSKHRKFHNPRLKTK